MHTYIYEFDLFYYFDDHWYYFKVDFQTSSALLSTMNLYLNYRVHRCRIFLRTNKTSVNLLLYISTYILTVGIRTYTLAELT